MAVSQARNTKKYHMHGMSIICILRDLQYTSLLYTFPFSLFFRQQLSAVKYPSACTFLKSNNQTDRGIQVYDDVQKFKFSIIYLNDSQKCVHTKFADESKNACCQIYCFTQTNTCHERRALYLLILDFFMVDHFCKPKMQVWGEVHTQKALLTHRA